MDTLQKFHWGIMAAMPPRARIGPKKPVRVYLRLWREDRQYTLEQVAGRIGPPEGVSKSTVSRWEKARRIPSADVLAAYSEAIGLKVPDLYRRPADGPSLDAMASGVPPEVRRDIEQIVARIVKRAS